MELLEELFSEEEVYLLFLGFYPKRKLARKKRKKRKGEKKERTLDV
jgi:hypothetical protein